MATYCTRHRQWCQFHEAELNNDPNICEMCYRMHYAGLYRCDPPEGAEIPPENTGIEVRLEEYPNYVDVGEALHRLIGVNLGNGNIPTDEQIDAILDAPIAQRRVLTQDHMDAAVNAFANAMTAPTPEPFFTTWQPNTTPPHQDAVIIDLDHLPEPEITVHQAVECIKRGEPITIWCAHCGSDTANPSFCGFDTYYDDDTICMCAFKTGKFFAGRYNLRPYLDILLGPDAPMQQY